MGQSLKVWLAEIQTGIASKLYQCGKYSHLETRCQCGQYSHLWAHDLPVLSELSSCLPSKWLPLLQFSTQGSPLFVCGSPLFLALFCWIYFQVFYSFGYFCTQNSHLNLLSCSSLLYKHTSSFVRVGLVSWNFPGVLATDYLGLFKYRIMLHANRYNLSLLFHFVDL